MCDDKDEVMRWLKEGLAEDAGVAKSRRAARVLVAFKVVAPQNAFVYPDYLKAVSQDNCKELSLLRKIVQFFLDTGSCKTAEISPISS